MARSLALSPWLSAAHCASGRPPCTSWITGASVSVKGLNLSSSPSRPSANPVRFRIACGLWAANAAFTKRTQAASFSVEIISGTGASPRRTISSYNASSVAVPAPSSAAR